MCFYLVTLVAICANIAHAKIHINANTDTVELYMCFYLVTLVAIFEIHCTYTNIHVNASTDRITHVFLSCYAGSHL
jgi:hypothetical protein